MTAEPVRARPLTVPPLGIGAVFQNVSAGNGTASFSMEEGQVLVAFRPAEPNDPGVVSLLDSNNVAVLTMDADGYSSYFVPHGGETYRFTCTSDCAMLAMVAPNDAR
jgi:hypothetical protein